MVAAGPYHVLDAPAKRAASGTRVERIKLDRERRERVAPDAEGWRQPSIVGRVPAESVVSCEGIGECEGDRSVHRFLAPEVAQPPKPMSEEGELTRGE